MADGAARGGRGHRRFIAGAVVLAAGAVVGVLALAMTVFPAERAISLSMDRDPAAGILDIPVAVERRMPAPGRLLTSERFRPAMTFRIRAIPGGGLGGNLEFCFKESDEHVVVFQHVRGCVDEVRVIHPFSIDCGGLIEQPGAAGLAAAMLSRPDLGAVDRGALDPGGNVHLDLLTVPATGRVIDVAGGGPSLPDVANPDACRLLPPPWSSADPIEIRRDMPERYVLIDHLGELIVVRAGAGGHDADSTEAGRQRGYGSPDAENIRHMLGSLYDIGFH